MTRGDRSASLALNICTAAVVIFLLLPIVIVIPSAFGESSTLDFPPVGFSLRWFRNAFDQPAFVSGFILSLQIAICSTFISLLIGGPAAYALVRKDFPGRWALEFLFLSPLFFPVIVLAVALAIALSKVGSGGTFAKLLFAHVLVTLPYAIRTLGASLRGVERSVEEAAATLGAGPLAIAWQILLPILRPGVIASATFCFIISFDEFTVSLFLARPDSMTLPIALYAYTDFNLDPTIAAVSTILLALPALVIVVGDRIFGIARHFG